MSYVVYGCHCPGCTGITLLGQHEEGPLAASFSLAPAPSQPVVAIQYTGDYRVDTLLAGLEYRWNANFALGTRATVTYSFMTAKPVYGGTDDGQGGIGFVAFTGEQQAAVTAIMSRLQLELGITLVPVADSASSYGQIRFGNNIQAFSSGYSWLPNSTGNARSGDVWIGLDRFGNPTLPVSGNYEWTTLVHEIGHALGLKHPGNYNAGSAPSTNPGNYLGTAEDNTNYSIMSYRDVLSGQERDWYGMYDLLTLKKLYGSGSYNAGDTVHNFVSSDGSVLKVIDDASGYDTIDVSALTRGAVVDMRPGGFSSVGTLRFGAAAVNNVSIDLTTVIEKFIGTPYNDTVFGNGVDNAFVLGQGGNTASGGAGIDTAIYGMARSAAQVSAAAGTVQVSAPGIQDTLTQTERLQFADAKLAFDVDGHAGMTAKVIGAVFGPSVLPAHPDYVGIGLSLLDGGMSYADLVQFALNAQLGSRTNAQVVNLLYNNIAGVPPSAAVLSSYASLLDNGSQSQAELGIFASEHAINASNIGLVGLAQTGLLYA